jgi:hypothetical protein
MSRLMRRLFAVALVLAVVVVGAVAWWFGDQARPDKVGPRFVDGLLRRHPGSTVDAVGGGMVRATLPSGLYVDVRLSTVFDACRENRFGCSHSVDAALADVGRAEASTHTPDRKTLEPMVVGDDAGFRYGFVTAPLIGSFEVRYALVSGVASTFVTGTIADKLGLTRDGLKSVALDRLRSEPQARLERIDDASGPLYRVRSSGDPAASLLDPDRMKRFADEIGTHRLYAAIPTSGTLALAPANDRSASALERLRTRLHASNARSIDHDVLAYDVDAASGQTLSIAARPPLQP